MYLVTLAQYELEKSQLLSIDAIDAFGKEIFDGNAIP
jgi:hypothetical protein